MTQRFGALLSSAASAALLLTLLAAFAVESYRDVMLYYGFNTLNPLIAGALAAGVLLVFLAVRTDTVSMAIGTGLALGLGAVILAVVTIWAIDGRLDVFLARGWAFPIQRYVLVALAVLIVIGAAVQAWHSGLFTTET